MDIDLTEKSNIKICGEIDNSNNMQLLDSFKSALLFDLEHYCIDLTGLQYIDSAGINAIVWFAKQAADKSRNITILVKPSPVLKIFDLTEIDKIKNIDLLIDDNPQKAQKDTV